MKPGTKALMAIMALAIALPLAAGPLHGQVAASDAAAALWARYAALQDELSENPFDQPIHLVSNRNDDHISGELNGVLEYPFQTAKEIFRTAHNWCDIMMLHLNVKHCRTSETGSNQSLTVFIGGKRHQSLESAHRGEYRYRVLENSTDYIKVALTSDRGPFQTRNYRIVLEAVPVEGDNTFVHFSYAYDFGGLARTAKSLYFHTVGRDKVGFTVVDTEPDGRPIHVDGMRGALERNIMRYYLAMKAFLGALAVPEAEQLEKRLHDWFAFTERYPLQLRELSENDYIRMKRQEFQRQDTPHSVYSPAGPSW